MNIYQKWMIARAAMAFVGACIPSMVLFFSTLCLVRSQKDPARTAFTYLKFALFIFSAYTLFDTVSLSGIIAYNFMYSKIDLEDPDPDYDWDNYFTVLHGLGISTRVFDLVAWTSQMITNILIAIILLRLSTAILSINSGSTVSIGKKLRLASYGIALVLGTLALTFLGLGIRFVYEYWYNDYDIAETCYVNGLRIRLAIDVFILVISLVVIARAVTVKMQTKADKSLTWASTMLVAASVVWLLHTSFTMASFVSWYSLDMTSSVGPVEWQTYFYIFEIIFGIWPQFAVLIMVYVMGRTKANGIWSGQKKPLNKLEDGQQS
ncbi:hypothetical protein FLONG3_9736 [Fusarium longipes]|uniref:Uncharacterized protein n=1 Tax=Fusarium longipes TaxID=694270 RepID=A0A395RVI0_9HYPO|nr:hypothetical protein FLONG3_9736 [Fusarium longipes]